LFDGYSSPTDLIKPHEAGIKMKKSALINSELSYLVSTLGHTDEVTICDAGLPIADEVQRIDLALTHGVPAFLDTVKVYLSEAQIEGVILAEEFKQVSPELHDALLSVIEQERETSGKAISISYISHEDFKTKTLDSRAVVRTGECTPYANVIFQAGVVF
jgi:D-ribose pyranase